MKSNCDIIKRFKITSYTIIQLWLIVGTLIKLVMKFFCLQSVPPWQTTDYSFEQLLLQCLTSGLWTSALPEWLPTLCSIAVWYFHWRCPSCFHECSWRLSLQKSTKFMKVIHTFNGRSSNAQSRLRDLVTCCT